MITHKSGQGLEGSGNERVEMGLRLDIVEDRFRATFGASGYSATNEIVEWRGTVREGEIGKFAPENSFMEVDLKQVRRPFTFLHEDRVEFGNHSYTFGGEKMEKLLRRIVAAGMKTIEANQESSG